MKKNINIKAKRVFFIGIGGISMSALAMLTKTQNVIVAGSDMNVSPLSKNLEKCISIYYGHKKSNIIRFKPDLVVYTGAIPKDNPELKFALENGIQCIERSVYLGEICNNYKHVIAISGTHGKTTTTAMIGEIFLKANLNPTIHVGGEVVNLKSNLYIGGLDYFITEACEYKKSFEHIKSETAIITTIECDHMDCYKDYDDLLLSFNNFANMSKQVLIKGDNGLIKQLDNKHIFTFGTDDSNYYIDNLEVINDGYQFDVVKDNQFYSTFCIHLMGEYNVYNALIAIAVADMYGISVAHIYSALSNFKGVLRRNEMLGYVNKIPVYADYCHHPTEIKNSIASFLTHYKRIICIFQPHTYTRTLTLFNDFLKCFDGVKQLVIYKTYPAREEYIERGSETYLYNHIKHRNKRLIMSSQNLIKYVNNVTDADVIVVLGAGDVYSIVKDNI